LVEGTVDLAFYEDTSDFVGWTVVDFKTDRELEAMSVYIGQVKVYSEAISDLAILSSVRCVRETHRG
jgi:ATP-dependent helicase/nuclease subunit A